MLMDVLEDSRTSGSVCVSLNVLSLQSEMTSSYALAVDFIRAASTHLEPYIQLV